MNKKNGFCVFIINDVIFEYMFKTGNGISCTGVTSCRVLVI